MSFFCRSLTIKNKYNFGANTPIFKVKTEHYMFVFVIVKSIYVIPIKLSENYEITKIECNSDYDIIISYTTYNNRCKIVTPVMISKIIYKTDSTVTLDSLTYRNEYYYDLNLYEDLNSIDNKAVTVLLEHITKSSDYKSLKFMDPSYHESEDESTEEFEIESDEDSDDDDYW